MAQTPAQKAAAAKATKIDAMNDAAAAAYQAARTAPAKTQAQVDAINAGVKSVTESTGNVYDASKALTVNNQVSINPNVQTTENYSTGQRVNTLTAFDQDAFATLMGQFNQWGLGSLAGVVTQLLTQGLTYDSVMTKIKYDTTTNPATNKPYNYDYTVRFAGNEARKAKGLNALDERSYLQLEDSYASTLRAYGLGNMLSPKAEDNHAKFATWIGNDIASTEFKERIDQVSTRITNADPNVLANFKQYYPELNKTDLISYFLAPDESLPLLKQKITASEIGAAANMQGFTTDKARAEEFAKLGETYAQAQLDYGKIAEVLPTSQKLSSIYGEENINYGLRTGEDEFIKNDAQAKLKRNRLASKERAMFSGDSGLSAQFSSLGNSIQGKF